MVLGKCQVIYKDKHALITSDPLATIWRQAKYEQYMSSSESKRLPTKIAICSEALLALLEKWTLRQAQVKHMTSKSKMQSKTEQS